jgi:hypothetical protein
MRPLMTAPVTAASDEREQDLSWFRSFVAASRWRFAKTYVESYPHEYTLEGWGADHQRFSQAVDCIERWGVVESFWGSRRKYVYVDDRKYWHMEDAHAADPATRPTLINRTWLDVGRYRDEARRLGFDGERLEHLVARWMMLLDRARRGRG